MEVHYVYFINKFHIKPPLYISLSTVFMICSLFLPAIGASLVNTY